LRNSLPAGIAARPAAACQLLTFGLAEESFGVDLLRVQEIRRWEPVIRVPHAPPHTLGVLNFRGAIIPVVDLRVRLGMSTAELSALTVIIVLSTTDAFSREYGIVVDRVDEVVDVATEEMREAPQLGAQPGPPVLRGLAALDRKMVMLLDVDRLIGAADTANPLAACA
jgi:purine-binding chemotaxis protein CheW